MSWRLEKRSFDLSRKMDSVYRELMSLEIYTTLTVLLQNKRRQKARLGHLGAFSALGTLMDLAFVFVLQVGLSMH